MRLVGLMLLAVMAFAEVGTITQDELVRRTQELCDAVAVGKQAPWKRYYAEDAMYFDEKGRSMDKAKLVADIAPLPEGYSGTIRVTRPQSRLVGTTAILSYDLDETEIIYGQHLTARYHGTDTWMFRGGQWQIVATQMLRYYEDPAVGKVDSARLDEFTGIYELGPGVTMSVTRDGDRLYSKRSDRAKELLLPETGELFFRAGVEGRRLFRRDGSGRVDALIDRRNNQDVVWRRL
jgi:hypothetical protein